MPASRPKKAAFAILGDPGYRDIGVQLLGQRMVARHGVLLAAFLI
jgi:hypothetical protein